MVDKCIECKTEVTAHAGTPFCKECAGGFYNVEEANNERE